MKKRFIILLALFLTAISGFAQEKAYIYIRRNPALVYDYSVSINQINVGTYKDVLKIEVNKGDYFF